MIPGQSDKFEGVITIPETVPTNLGCYSSIAVTSIIRVEYYLELHVKSTALFCNVVAVSLPIVIGTHLENSLK